MIQLLLELVFKTTFLRLLPFFSLENLHNYHNLFKHIY